MITATPTPYADLNTVLAELVAGVREALGENLIGIYLQGSFAVGDFDRDSDVDFLVVLRRDLFEGELAAVQALHGRIYDRANPWAKHLEGSYIPMEALRWYAPTGDATLWYLDNCSRELIRSDHDNTQVVRWVVRERGIPLVGPDPRTLIEPVTGNALRQEVRAVMRHWAALLFAEPGQMNNRWYQPFAVLSYCRMLQTLETGTVESKPASACWAQQTLAPEWAGLIQRAWNERPDPSRKVTQTADPDDVRETLAFIRYALERGGVGGASTA